MRGLDHLAGLLEQGQCHRHDVERRVSPLPTIELMPGLDAAPQARSALGGDVDDWPGLRFVAQPRQPMGHMQGVVQRKKALEGARGAKEHAHRVGRDDVLDGPSELPGALLQLHQRQQRYPARSGLGIGVGTSEFARSWRQRCIVACTLGPTQVQRLPEEPGQAQSSGLPRGVGLEAAPAPAAILGIKLGAGL